MIYPITPVAKPRMTQSDKWKKRASVLKYRAFCDECRYRMGALDLNHKSIVFIMPMPKSWSNKRKASMIGAPHQQRPDLSNLLKALEDALYSKKHTGREDAEVWRLAKLAKIWGEEGGIWVHNDSC